MGRRVLLSLGLSVSAALAGCTVDDRPVLLVEGDSHAQFACADCHAGGVTTRAVAAVPSETCTASDCHATGGPREVSVGPVTFLHRGHAGDSIVAMECAGCHTHPSGAAPLSAGLEACSLCHLNDQSAGESGECRLCHGQPAHEGVTSQGVAIPHSSVPWIDGACVRCHYDVTEALVDVGERTCITCHEEEERVVARAVGTDLHASHVTVNCTSCHEGQSHHIRAMSTAVVLDCAQCHVEVHALEVSEEFASAEGCADCHAEVHAEQQALLLGVVPGRDDVRPSDKFLDGLTCRSCHAPPVGADPTRAVRGNDSGCTTCHRSEYATVLQWWRQGTRERLTSVEQAVAVARGRLGSAGEPGRHLAAADSLVDVVRAGGAIHNLRLSHQLLERALSDVGDAWRAAGDAPPSLPDLGREPSMGLCSYCHYRLDEPWLFEEMSGPFHASIGGDG